MTPARRSNRSARVFRAAASRVFVAGHRGMVGAAVARALEAAGTEVLTAPRPGVDLRRQAEVEAWLGESRPDAVVVAAARVGGILANDTRPAEFLYDNLAIASALIEGARRTGVRRLLFLGSSCAYPRAAPQPIPETALLTGPLEATSEWYAVAKIAGVKLCQAYRLQYGCDFVSAMPCNLYGPGDNFDPEGGHVIPGLMRRMHEAQAAEAPRVTVWGTGAPRREFLHVDDLARAAVVILERYAGAAPVNVGTGEDVGIAELARRVGEAVGYRGRFAFDPSKPDGTPRKVLDVSRIRALGWRPRVALADGLADTYRWFLEHVAGAPEHAA
jgi:GDP-L-fucose synthase